jgi:anti-anti-sigma factor
VDGLRGGEHARKIMIPFLIRRLLLVALLVFIVLASPALHSAVLAQVDASVVVLDLARVNTIDAGGLGVMLELREHTESKGIELRLENVTKLVRQILEITKLDSVFEISGNNRPDVAIHQRPPVFLQTVSCA